MVFVTVSQREFIGASDWEVLRAGFRQIYFLIVDLACSMANCLMV